MNSSRANLRCSSAQSSIQVAMVMLAFAVAACGGAEPLQAKTTGADLASASRSSGSGSAATSLGTAANFAILGGPAVTCTDSSITGDVGAGFAGAPVTQTNCPVVGTVHRGDATAQRAYNDFRLAYLATAKVACPTDPAHNLTGTLAARTLTPGVYCFAAAAALTGTLTLDGQGNANATWLFKIAGDPLIPAALTATTFSVVMSNGAMPCNVTWWVNAAATFTSSSMVGTIMAGAGITFTGVGSFIGRALATQAVTVTTESSFGSCGGAAGGGGGGGGGGGCSSSGDRITGGGAIALASGAKGTFAVSGGIKKDAFRGHLEYNDHGSRGIDVKGTGVTAYRVVDDVTRHIEGTANVNRASGYTYQVDVSDNGEPGRKDTFSLGIFSGGEKVYSASGTLKGGNIQLHKSDKDGCDDDEGDDDDHGGDHDDDHGGEHGDKGHHGD